MTPETQAPETQAAEQARPPKIAFMATCLVDLMRPSVGFAAVKLLEDAGCDVRVPQGQTCCGQPAWNSGDRANAKRLARRTIEAFEDYDAVVLPSGSCAATIIKDYPEMFSAGDRWRARAEKLAAKTFEITAFLADVLPDAKVAAEAPAGVGKVTYHDSCSGLRSLGIKDQPRALLGRVKGVEVSEMVESEVCCGFGGTFCVKYPEISERMVADKARNAEESGAELLLAGDLGCLMNMAGRLTREGRPVKARHVVEVLAGMTDGPAIGEGSK
ncbi:L-lactate dehydrogenase complex protein LldE [Albimonas donghaensis]|uniref:L-lactate dehydrogenase complex protein LldE n=1 Tax=Albimonas donghaensis TaxID=356660 RepID=A0A1H3CYM3_9RHOB|nr:(Fe-S)-binding protein [Albimonas donghaensis]SDX58549.1 L-lactate dehydrogenase complex protein LldE [Albimonas donghaensis]